MTSPTGMSCETCRDLLIELVCDELSAAAAAQVRAHALKCERCGPELQKLSVTLDASRSLELLTPSPEVERRIMQAARDGIAGRARGPAREASAGASYGITAWFTRLGSFAMSPQVAMASVLLLVVGIGLYALPFGHDAESTALRATEEENESERAASSASPAASATATPIAEPEAQERAREPQKHSRPQAEHDVAKSLAPGSKDLGNAAASRPRKAASSEDKTRMAPREEALGALAEDKEARGAAQPFPGTKAAGRSAERAETAQPARKGSLRADDFDPFEAESAPKAQVGARPASKAEQPAAPTDRAASGGGYAPAPPAAAAATPSSAPKPSAAPSVTPAESEGSSFAKAGPSSEKRAKSDGAGPLEQGISAVKRGDHDAAESLLKPLAANGAAAERAAATLWLARSLRERGDCTRALSYYRVLTQQVTAASAVLEEAADCYTRTGNRAAAERLRARIAPPAKQ